MTDQASQSQGVETAFRAIARAVIRRVCEEYPSSLGYELFLRLWAAYPFRANDPSMQQLWHEEVMRVVSVPNQPPLTDSVSIDSPSATDWIQ